MTEQWLDANKIKVGIVGGTGYTGIELLRLLVSHPHADIVAVTSRTECDKAIGDVYPNLRNHIDLSFSSPQSSDLLACDVVFFATPHGIAMQHAPELLKNGVKVIDLSADFRLQDPDQWEHWYGQPHACPELLIESIYGLCEVNRTSIRNARLVANPGCYPTAIQLGFLPLLEAGLIDSSRLIADAKSGVSGAGRVPSTAMLFCEAGENFKAYSAHGHRHLPEIVQGLNCVSKVNVALTFVPHLVPMARGIYATLYATLRSASCQLDIQELYESRYGNEPFVDILPSGSHPDTRTVRATNTCSIALHRPQDADTIVVLSTIDNLMKGAAGQAIQNMNVMFGLDEWQGLNYVATLP